MIDVFDSSVDALENYTRILSFIQSFTHPPGSFTTRVDATRASTRGPFVLSRSLSLSLRRPPSPRHLARRHRSRLRASDRSSARGVSRGDHHPCGRAERKSVSTRVRSIGSTAHLNNLRVDGEHVSRQTRSDDDDDDDDDKRPTDPSTDRVPRAPSP